MSRILITGLTGFVGSHLAEYLLSLPEGHQIYGTMRWRSRTENVDHLRARLTLLECDVRDGTSVREAVATARPDYLFHLAAQSHIPTSWHAPTDTVLTNLLGQLNVLESLREQNLTGCVVLVPGSSEEYGVVPKEALPIQETCEPHPVSPYAVSKVAQDMLAYQYAQSYGLRIIRTRAFNHIGPRRAIDYAEASFAAQLAGMEKRGASPVMKVGNLAAIRDYCDVRDVVEAYWLALQKGAPGEVYNICSGQGRPVQEILDLLISMSTVKPKLEVDPERLRPHDAPALVGDCRRFHELTGWAPKRALAQTLRDILEHWRQRV
ncbi:MAG TPA: GDP-mannose 4,6-dehydratase [Candidatus Xenobia bacterium]|jgi:GDP-4-dehydro-6-deoxy-D-mannose reductase